MALSRTLLGTKAGIDAGTTGRFDGTGYAARGGGCCRGTNSGAGDEYIGAEGGGAEGGGAEGGGADGGGADGGGADGGGADGGGADGGGADGGGAETMGGGVGVAAGVSSLVSGTDNARLKPSVLTSVPLY